MIDACSGGRHVEDQRTHKGPGDVQLYPLVVESAAQEDCLVVLAAPSGHTASDGVFTSTLCDVLANHALIKKHHLLDLLLLVENTLHTEEGTTCELINKGFKKHFEFVLHEVCVCVPVLLQMYQENRVLLQAKCRMVGERGGR